MTVQQVLVGAGPLPFWHGSVSSACTQIRTIIYEHDAGLLASWICDETSTWEVSNEDTRQDHSSG